MKIFILIALLFASMSLSAQTAGEQLATKIAQKMKDTLSLTEQQYNQIYGINMQLHQQKQQMFGQYKGDSLRLQLQRIESTRDTLYSAALSAEKYQLYKQKKINLVNNN